MKRILSLLLSVALVFPIAAPSAAAVDHIVIPWGDGTTVTPPEPPSAPEAPVIVPTIPLEPENNVVPVAPSAPSAPPASNKTYQATRSNMMISVDGTLVEPAGYAIEGYTYYKLRDIAYLLIGKPCTFAVGWDQPTYSVTMTLGVPYTPAGGELKKESASTATAKVGDCNLLLDGEKVDLDGYLIHNNNYFKLRDIGDALGFRVDYDDATRTILLDTTPVIEEPDEDDEDNENDEDLSDEEEVPAIDYFVERTVHLDGKLKIVLDAGHGGGDAGTLGTASIDFEGPVGPVAAGDKISEKDFNLAVALRLQELLEDEDVEVVMVRDDDTNVPAKQRQELLKELAVDADLVFSVHHNAANGKVSGAELLAQVYFSEGGVGQEFAEIYQSEIEAVGQSMRRVVFEKQDNGLDYYFVLRSAASVGCLAFISEFCFLDNAEDQQWIFGEDALDAEADALFNTIMTYFEDHEY